MKFPVQRKHHRTRYSPGQLRTDLASYKREKVMRDQLSVWAERIQCSIRTMKPCGHCESMCSVDGLPAGWKRLPAVLRSIDANWRLCSCHEALSGKSKQRRSQLWYREIKTFMQHTKNKIFMQHTENKYFSVDHERAARCAWHRFCIFIIFF